MCYFPTAKVVEAAQAELDYALAHPTSSTNDQLEPSPPLSRPTVEPRPITTEDIQLFQTPDNLHGKQFIFSPNADDSGMYEVTGYYMGRDKSIEYYEILFEDCPEPIRVGLKEMMGMLEDSLVYLQ